MAKHWNLGDDKYDYTTGSMSSKESAKEGSSVWTQLFFGNNQDKNQNTPTISIHDEPSWPSYNVHYDSDGPEYLTSKSSSSEEEDKYQSGRVIDDNDYTEPDWETHVSSRIKNAMKGKRFQSCLPTKEGVVNSDVDAPTNIESQDGGDANGLLQLCMLRNSHHSSKSSDDHDHVIQERQSDDDDDDDDDCDTTNKKCNSLSQNNDETGEGAIVETTLLSNHECLIKDETVPNISITKKATSDFLKATLSDHKCPLQERDAEVPDQPAIVDVEQQSNAMISKIGLMSISENKVNDSAADSNHTRTTADSTVVDSSHSRVSAASHPSLDPVFTLNNSVEVSQGPSQIKEEDGNNDASSNDKDDDDSSAWFGFHENCNAAPAILAPVKTGSTVNYSTQDYDNDTDDDEGIDTLTRTIASLDTHSFLESDESTTLSASTSFNLYYDTNTNTAIADELGRLGEDLLYLFSPRCLLLEEEIVFHDEDEADIDEQTRQQNQGVGSFFKFIGMGTESPDCCGCNESGEDIILSNASIIDDCEEEDSKTKKPKSKKSSLLEDCNEKEEDNTSDEEGAIAILMENPTNDEDRAKKKEYTDFFEIEIKLEDYDKRTAAENTIVKLSAEVYQEIYNFESLAETLDLELHVIHESSFGSNITDTKDRYSSFHESSTRDDTWMIASHSSDSMGIPPPPEDQSIPSQMEYLREDGTISFDSLLSDDLSIPVPSEPLKQQKEENKNSPKETSFPSNEAPQQYNGLSNHRRRHTIDYIPTFYSKITKGSIQPISPAVGGCNNSNQPLFNFDKRAKLPFLADQKKITTTVQSSFVENEENQSPAKALHLQQPLPFNGLKPATESMKNKSKHPKTEFPLDDENYNGSNSFQSFIWKTIQDNEKEGCQPSDGKLGPVIDEHTGEETPEEEEENISQPFPKGILRKTGSLSSGRRIRWDEEQLATKEDKGVMHSSGRQSRSICRIDQLILHVTEIQDLYDAEETLLATTSRRRSNRSQRHSLRAVMSHQGYLC
jgi:hypothetical protein